MKKLLNIIVFLSISTALFAQNVDFKSIHQMQLEYYNNLGSTTQAQFDSLNDFKLIPKLKDKSNCTLNKIVFGWHTYWTGSAYDNYDWSSLSDLCYFSYEFDVNTGDPTDTHSWSTVDVVTEAQNNGTRVHLCVTLFSDHATFLTNSSAEQTLITNLISAVQQRNANGINIDFEGVPSAQSANFTDFMIDLCNQFHTQIPGSIVSIALPAVNWNSTFDVNAMNDYVDLFIIMAYNYYYSGSSNAGPVSPKNHGNFWSQYDASRSVVYYLNQGVSRSKLCLGIPYYGFDWPTTDNTVNSSTTGSGSAKSYKIAVQNAQTYGRLWDNPSSTPYYMYESGGWHQTWYDDDESLGMKYDAINIQDIAGIGIWALGYDDGYTQLWDIIEQKFTNCAPTVDCYGTTTDMGGPGNYYNNEDWTYTIAPQNAYSVSLTFNNFDVELNYDTLFVYDGTYITSPLIGTYTGTTNPGTLVANSGAITLRFQSDGATTALGWVADWSCLEDNIPPTSSVNVNGQWQTTDFLAYFTDQDDSAGTGIDKKFYQPLEYTGTEWIANKNNGFFNDNFEYSINPDWTVPPNAGIWLVNNGHLRQPDQSVGNSNIYTQLEQNAPNEYLYQWSALIDGLGTNRRCGLHIFVSDSTLPNRGNSYLIWFLSDQQKVKIYKTLNDTLYLKAENSININTGLWYDFKTIYNPVTGNIQAFIDNSQVASWTDSLPITSGKYISLRNGDSDVQYDDIKVYKSRQDTAFITVGTNINDDVRFQNPNPSAAACRIKSVVTDSVGNFSVAAGLDVNIDWTQPDTGAYVYDGINTDIDTTNFQEQLSANWSAFQDTNSEIKKYLYSIGISQQDTSIVGWTDNGLDTNITKNSLTLISGQTYYFNIKAENNALLFSDIISSDGQTYIDTSDNIKEISNDFNLTVYPNPFNDNVIITYTLKKQERVKISLTDIPGREIIIADYNNQGKGNYKININTKELGIHKGIYLLKFSTKTKNINIHLVKY